MIFAGEKPFNCPYQDCDRIFARSDELSRHKRAHTGEKKFECDVCHKRFSQAGGLKQHMITHTGQKDHQCPTCGKWFGFKVRLLSFYIQTI